MSNKLTEIKVAGRYAKALFEGAKEAGSLDAVTADLESLKTLLADVPQFSEYLGNPTIAVAEKREFVAQQINGNVNDLVANLFNVLVENDRAQTVPYIIEAFEDLIRKSNNVGRAEVVSAVALDDKLLKKAADTIKKRFGYADVVIENRVDADVLGGAVIKVEDTIIDGSYRGRLDEMKKQLVGV